MDGRAAFRDSRRVVADAFRGKAAPRPGLPRCRVFRFGDYGDAARNSSLDSARLLVLGRVEGTLIRSTTPCTDPLAEFSHACHEMETIPNSRWIADGSRTGAVAKLQIGALLANPVETAMGDRKLGPGLRPANSGASNVRVAGNATDGTGEASEYRGRSNCTGQFASRNSPDPSRNEPRFSRRSWKEGSDQSIEPQK